MPDSPIQPAMWLNLFSRQARPGLPLREQLCAALRRAIAGGSLRPGERLPSTRMLAADLALSRVTAEAAYAQLEAEGYLERQVGRGTSVRAGAQGLDPVPDESAAGACEPLRPMPALSRRGQALFAGGACRDPRQPRAFDAGMPDLDAFPLALWRQLAARCLRQHGAALLGYGDPQGYAPLRAAIAGYLGQSRGVRCDASQVVVVTSSQQALVLLANLLLDPGDTVALEEPGYAGARTAFAAAGARLLPIPVDAGGMCAPEAAASARLCYLTPSHQYPSGVTLGLERRLALIAHARRGGGWLIEDDYDSEFQYDGRPVPAMQGLDRHGRVIYLGTFSKVLFPSLRLAYMVVPPELVDAVVVARTVYDGHCAQSAQALTADFIVRGHFATHLRQMRALYRSRRDLLLEQLQQPGLEWLAPQAAAGGLQLAAFLPKGSEAAMTRQAARLGLATPSLSRLYLGPQARDGWLLGFAGLQNRDIGAATALLARIKP